MKTLIVGDIHGRVNIVEDALAQEHPVIFVGDIADSFDKDISEHLKCFELIFKGIDNGKAQCLYGNHELSYIHPSMLCSGFKPAMQMHMNGGLLKEIEKRFKNFLFYPADNPVLITHAGLSRNFWNQSLDNLEKVLNEWCEDISSPAYAIGRNRGGRSSCGGIFWCDWDEFEPIPGLTQVFGHTRGKTLRERNGNFCIDYNDFQQQHFYMDLP